MKKSKARKLALHADYILIDPNLPESGSFKVDNVIEDEGIVIACGDMVSESTKKLVGKKVKFNAWAADEKKFDGRKVYFVCESANAICATIT